MIRHVRKGKYGTWLAFVRGYDLAITAVFLYSAQIAQKKNLRKMLILYM